MKEKDGCQWQDYTNNSEGQIQKMRFDRFILKKIALNNLYNGRQVMIQIVLKCFDAFILRFYFFLFRFGQKAKQFLQN